MNLIFNIKGNNMPSNIIQINGSKKMTWIVPDSKMDKLIEKLNKVGDKEKES